MYYRRKYILALLQQFDGTLDNLNFQKLLFLATRKQEKKAFDFVPYKYGSFSFQANQDLHTMIKLGNVEREDRSWKCLDSSDYKSQLKKEDVSSLNWVHRTYKDFNGEELIKETYRKYPFFAINSKIANKVLTVKEMDKVNAQRRIKDGPMFFTIGYEGISLETYLNKLIINDVRLLVDVRKNSFSMKYGFSKKQLLNSCESLGIKFLHMPQLGIESQERKELHSLNDYKELFDNYKKTTLKENKSYLAQLKDLCEEYKRVAITCFEKEVCMCHRGVVAKELGKMKDWEIVQKNL
ncbi:DUF488 family protein [Flagellimonas pacifica]|uniref:Uncharacterized conserved protein, DUF488 family n=1 Tax=Flagellimonas pacifica TaxID=1247520 RepID=A0A285MVF9_9FLAO|nr:DUF488 family protein [Allomuricauda parva]SNZ01182.1 Uncharacterized conserved protein, DUF488 family [Allomuricauda parva]